MSPRHVQGNNTNTPYKIGDNFILSEDRQTRKWSVNLALSVCQLNAWPIDNLTQTELPIDKSMSK